MIRVSIRGDGEPTVELGDDDAVAFVDRDWVCSREPGHIRAIVVDVGGQLWWGEERLRSIDEFDSGVLAGQTLATFAGDVAAAVPEPERTATWVIGEGVVAAQVRALLGGQGSGGTRPPAVVVMTSDPSDVAQATHRVCDGGIVVLAGDCSGPLELNLYSDVHRRGLRLTGVPGEGTPRPLADVTLPEPVPVAAGAALPPGLWYRVTKGS